MSSVSFFHGKLFKKVSHDELGQISCKMTVMITTIEIPRNPPPQKIHANYLKCFSIRKMHVCINKKSASIIFFVVY